MIRGSGKAIVDVVYEKQQLNMPVHVIKGSGPSLFGRDWLAKVNLNWGSIKKICSELETVLTRHNVLFEEGLGTLQGVQAKLSLKQDATPKYCKVRSVPHALREAIEQDLERLENLGVLEKVNFSEWTSPIVAVPKSDNSVRICGDYKSTVNPNLDCEQYPLPKAGDLFVAMQGGEKFTKMDLKCAYNQIVLDEESRQILTLNTHKGLFRPPG